MSDFDFDEIDKAVADALTPDDSDAASDVVADVDSNQDAVREEAPVSKPEPEPVDAREREEETIPSPSPRPTPAARRSSGRFMDVVHPSSDMRSQSTAFTPPSSRISHEGPRIETPAQISEQKPTPTPDANESEPEAQPIESPFLPDAKVEKRPLGAFSDNTPVTEADNEDELLLEAPDEPRIEAHSMPDPIDFAAHASALPSETEDTGTLQVEAPIHQPEAAPEPVVEEAPVVAEEPSAIEAEKPEEHTTPQTPETEPVGPASITQQYTEQPSSAPSSGAIYDTETYHKPLAPAPKKRSGAWTYIWIIILVILGAAAGFAFYKFVLPMLGV